MQQVKETKNIPLERSKDVLTILNTVLNTNGWTDIRSDIEQNYITAKLSDHWATGMFEWDAHVEIMIRWAPLAWAGRSSSQPVSVINSGRAQLVPHSALPSAQPGHNLYVTITQRKGKRSPVLLNELAAKVNAGLEQEVAFLKLKGAPKADPELYPAAKLAEPHELRAQKYMEPLNDHRSFIISKSGDQFISTTPQRAVRHVLVCGPTGSGKSRSVFIPNIIERTNCSMIITEATAGSEQPHLYEHTAGWRAANGHKILYFNPDDPHSDQLNPLDMIRTTSDARAVCELVMKTTTQSSHKGDQYWDTAERMLLSALLMHVCGFRHEGKAHFGFIVELLNRSEAELWELVKDSPVKQARSRFKAFFSRGTDHTRNIVLSCLGQRLDLWNDEKTQALTNRTSFDVNELKDQLFTFYLSLAASKEESRPLVILVCHFLFELAKNTRFKHPITFMLDEFANIGFIHDFKGKLTTFRHAGLSFVLGMQDTAQVEKIYEKEAETLFTQPLTQIYFKPNGQKEAKALSERLGTTTVIDTEFQNGNVVYKKLERPLMSSEQIQFPREEGKILVFMEGTSPAFIDHIPWQAYDSFKEKYAVPERPVINIKNELDITTPGIAPGREAPWDPMDTNTAQRELNNRSREQVIADAQIDRQFSHQYDSGTSELIAASNGESSLTNPIVPKNASTEAEPQEAEEAYQQLKALLGTRDAAMEQLESLTAIYNELLAKNRNEEEQIFHQLAVLQALADELGAPSSSSSQAGPNAKGGLAPNKEVKPEKPMGLDYDAPWA